MLRRVPSEVATRYRAAAGGRGMTHAQYLTALVELRARIRAEADGPTIVCAQAGEVNTGSFDDFSAVADACEAAGAWLHVDGAFGL